MTRGSTMGLGLAALGRPAYINLGHGEDLGPHHSPRDLEQRCHAVLDAAWSAGIRYLDAARSYGRAEAFLSSWLHRRGIAPGQVTVGSKWGYTYTAGWRLQADEHEVKDHRLEVLDRQWIETRDLLGPYLDLYQVHSATLDSGVLDRSEVIDALRDRRRAGTRIGISVSGPGQSDTLRRALEIHVREPWLDTVQATWNLLCPHAGPALAEARTLGIRILVKEGVANGRLTPRAWEAPVRDILFAEADRLGTSPDALALAAVLDQPFVDVTLSGATTIDQLRSNLGALKVRLDEKARQGLGTLEQRPAEYWSRRSALPWN